MENNDSPADVAIIRQLCIDPSKFKNSVGKGTQNNLLDLMLKFLF